MRLRGALLAAVLVAGCGQNGGDSERESVLERAARVSSSYGATYLIRGIVVENGERSSVRGIGTVEAGGERDHFIARSSEGALDQITDGRFVYTRVDTLPPPLNEPPPEAKGARWIRFDQDRLLERQGFNPRALRDLQNADPAQQLVTFGSLAKETRREGVERVGGVETTRYSFVISLGEVIDRATQGADDPPPVADSVRRAQVPIVLWVDRQGRVRRTRARFAAEGTRVDATSEVNRFDRGLRVRVPSGREFYDATDELLEAGD